MNEDSETPTTDDAPPETLPAPADLAAERGKQEHEQLCRQAERWVSEKAWLLHGSTGVIGRAGEFFDGTTRRFKDNNGEELLATPVLVLETGDSFHIREGAFIHLEPNAIRFYQTMLNGARHLMDQAARLAVNIGVGEAVAVKILAGVFILQGKALLAAFERAQRDQNAQNGNAGKVVLFEPGKTE